MVPSTPSPILLRLDASSRHQGSVSRRLADSIETRWRAAHPGGTVQYRDLASARLPHIDSETIAGYYTPEAEMTPSLRAATALSDALIAELKAAHTVLIASPLYNFSLPSALKAWIDQIVRIGHTFSYDKCQFAVLVAGPRAVLALAYGASGYQGPLAAMDHLRPYLTQLLPFIGIQDVRVIAAEATTAPDAEHEIQRALTEVARLWATSPA